MVYGLRFLESDDASGDALSPLAPRKMRPFAPEPSPAPVLAPVQRRSVVEQPAGDYFSALRAQESGGNPFARATTSSASGLYQFTLPTWRGLIAQHPELGLREEDIMRPDAQEKAIRAFTADNAKILESQGIEATPGNLYLTHFLGAGDGPRFLHAMTRNPGATASALFPAAAKANPTIFFDKGRPRSLAEVYALQTRRFGGAALADASAEQPQPMRYAASDSIMTDATPEAPLPKGAIEGTRKPIRRDEAPPAETVAAPEPQAAPLPKGALEGSRKLLKPSAQISAPQRAAPPPPPQSWQDWAVKQAKDAYTAAHDVSRLMLHGATLGFSEPLAAKIKGTTVEEERAETERARKRAGGAGVVSELIGGVAPVSKLASGAAALGGAARGVPAFGDILASPWTTGAAAGAAAGGLQAVGEGRDPTTGAALGAAAGLGGKALGDIAASAAKGVTGLFAAHPVIPTTAALKATAQGLYDAAEQAGVIINDKATSRLASDIKQTMADFAYDPATEPMGAAVIRTLNRAEATGNVTLKGLDSLRKIAGKLRASDKPSEQALGARIVSDIDEFATGLKPGDLVTGDLGGVRDLEAARTVWRRAAKSSDLAEAMEKAELRAGGSGSGGNINNTTRQELRKLLQSSKSWTPDEKEALRSAIEGKPTANLLRLVGKMSPEGNGLMLTMHALAGTATGGTTAPLAVSGLAAKRLSDYLTAAAVKDLGDLIRAGGSREAQFGAEGLARRKAAESVAAPLQALGTAAGVEGAGALLDNRRKD